MICPNKGGGKVCGGKEQMMSMQRVAGHQWLMPVILAAQKAEIRRIAV
jgi:hypothetical protein